MPIPFTQYLRPHGKQVALTIDRPPEIEAKAKDLLDAGCWFDAEELRTGEVSLTCETGPEDDVRTLSIEVVDNGPPVIAAVDRLVTNAWIAVNRIEA